MKVKNRVKTHEDFQSIIQTNSKVSNKTYILYYTTNDKGYSRIGISASKKLGNAVIRARVRRQVRVIAKAVLGLDKSIDYVIIVRKKFLEETFQKNTESLRKLIIDIFNESRRIENEKEKNK